MVIETSRWALLSVLIISIMSKKTVAEEIQMSEPFGLKRSTKTKPIMNHKSKSVDKKYSSLLIIH